MRHSSGLRNRYRTGIGTYAAHSRGQTADSYGTYQQGRLIRSERIGGHTIDKQLPSFKATRNEGQ